jgi:hypothetical protein
MLGATQPNTIVTYPDGSNNVMQAKAANWSYSLKEGDEDEFFYWDFEEKLEDFVDDFNSSSKYVNFYIYALSGVSRGIFNGLTEEMEYIAGFITLILVLFTIL